MDEIAELSFYPLEITKEGRVFAARQKTAIAAAVRATGAGRLTDLFVVSHGWNNDKRDARKGIIRQDYRDFFCGSDWISGDWYVRSNGRGPEKIAELQGKMIDYLLELSGGQKPAFAPVQAANWRDH